MKFIKDTSWENVFEGWREREANDPGWINCATQIKGWPDWESWRRFTASGIKAEKRSWQIFKFTDPINEISAMLVGPYSGWQSRLPEKNKFSFEDLINIPEKYEFFKKHDKVLSMIKDFPAPTEFIGLIRKDSGKIICLEGHHRAVAVALAKKQDKSIDFKKEIFIALAELPVVEISILDQVLKRGTSKNPEN
ncbi:hypothetical protein KKH07_03030 [Patescibacteria group bacterium]|nr:hypothetical protein [Patescibacteria group bacterium]MBU1563931.1 hypothetical protein [Patescibacteria group bacterium]